MPKLTEKQLYETCLDIYYTDGLLFDLLNDLKLQITEAKKRKKKSEKLLKKAIEHYKKINGKEPNLPKYK